MRTLTLDGLVGLNPIAYAREAISLAAATEEHGARLFSNGAVTSGVLRTEQTLSDQAYERLKKDFEERHTGLGNAHRPMILEMGLDWKSMALNAEDSQFLETRKFQLEEICRLFRVPLHMVQNTDRATFNNIEELGLGFINYSLVPYQTGRLARSIGYMVPRASKHRPGFMARIAPNQRNGEGNRRITGDFYPAFLFYGVRRGAKRRRSHHRGASGGSGWRLAPRNNFMVETLEKNRSWTRYFLARELRKSLKPERRRR